MSAEKPGRTEAVDRVLDGLPVADGLPGELFALVDSLDRSPALKRALTDPNLPDAQRTGLAHALFDSRVSEPAARVLAEAAGQRWNSGRHLADTIERQGVRAQLRIAEAGGGLDSVEDELFRFGRVVDGDPALRAAITDRTASIERREGLVDSLLGGKVGGATVLLAKRAIRARERNFAWTLESYVQLAAEMRDRTIAVVRVARPLTGEQRERLARTLTRQAGRQVTIQEIVEPGLIGGVRVEMGSQVIEGTVAGRLADARRQFG
ncbi:F-type H+-transporting ATPase subunit delta [Friedmanniella endophytica]|uniref:ATP synthase subunit delta n=1 Tax=Microlunatus kandeliicorticis TaxID=1759536 RepID=A0A7W3IUK7_9ACTN|nr:F0F1 ATP synthase subunit delta [Microlunatus kandeliicorticis]MBA8795544.1 F-type H+-transporting ATPase subunit delta [Microlunatus kandeliicorticis]